MAKSNKVETAKDRLYKLMKKHRKEYNKISKYTKKEMNKKSPTLNKEQTKYI